MRGKRASQILLSYVDFMQGDLVSAKHAHGSRQMFAHDLFVIS